MDRTLTSEQGGFRKALERWYFFRPVLYRPANLRKYAKHPVLTAAMLYMYVCLSFIGIAALLKSRLLGGK